MLFVHNLLLESSSAFYSKFLQYKNLLFPILNLKHRQIYYQSDIYKLWESSNAFTPEVKKGKKSFTIIMPPPNASDPLHIGHARFVAIQDVLIRYHRMKGESALWLPGADHAGIETQFVFERKLREKGKSR